MLSPPYQQKPIKNLVIRLNPACPGHNFGRAAYEEAEQA